MYRHLSFIRTYRKARAFMLRAMDLNEFGCFFFLICISSSLFPQRGTILDSDASQASILMQAKTLTKRSFVNMSRDIGYYWLRLVIYIFVAICVGSLYLNVGTSYSAILVGHLLICLITFNPCSWRFIDAIHELLPSIFDCNKL